MNGNKTTSYPAKLFGKKSYSTGEKALAIVLHKRVSGGVMFGSEESNFFF